MNSKFRIYSKFTIHKKVLTKIRLVSDTFKKYLDTDTLRKKYLDTDTRSLTVREENVNDKNFLKLVFTFFWLALIVFSVFVAALIWVAAVRFEAVLTKGNINASAFSFLFRCLRNQKLTIVNSTKAANTNAVHRPIHTSIAWKEVYDNSMTWIVHD